MASYGAQQHTPLWSLELCALYALCGSMLPSAVAEPTTVGLLIGRAGPWPGWLPGLAWCGGCWSPSGQDWVLEWLAAEPSGVQGWFLPAGGQGQVLE